MIESRVYLRASQARPTVRGTRTAGGSRQTGITRRCSCRRRGDDVVCFVNDVFVCADSRWFYVNVSMFWMFKGLNCVKGLLASRIYKNVQSLTQNGSLFCSLLNFRACISTLRKHSQPANHSQQIRTICQVVCPKRLLRCMILGVLI